MVDPTIMLLDEDTAELTLIRQELEQLGHSVTMVHSWSRFELAAVSQAADLVVVDPAADGFPGIEVVRMIRKALPAADVLVRSHIPDMDSVISAFRLGARDYLTKPCSPTEVAETVDFWLKRKAAFIAERRVEHMELRLELKDTVGPFIKRLKATQLTEDQKKWVDELEARINQVISPFVLS